MCFNMLTLANSGERQSGHKPSPFQSYTMYAVANTAIFLCEAAFEHDKNIPKTRNV